MTARRRLSVDHRHLGIRLGHQGIDERKARRARPHNQIIGISNHVLAPVSRATSLILKATIKPYPPR